MNADEIALAIRDILREHGHLARDPDALKMETDLNEVGMTSHASVNIMLAIEGRFNVEFPDHMLTRSVFSSIGSMQSAVMQLLGE